MQCQLIPLGGEYYHAAHVQESEVGRPSSKTYVYRTTQTLRAEIRRPMNDVRTCQYCPRRPCDLGESTQPNSCGRSSQGATSGDQVLERKIRDGVGRTPTYC